MKLLSSLSLIAAFAVIVPSASIAAEKKAAKKESAAPAAEAKSAEKKPAEGKAKALPMNSRVDAIDSAAKTFTQKTKDGKEVKHVLSASAEIKNNGADAKFEDIKVGDTVAGSRIKKSDTEYEVVKITKFGPAAPKKAKAAAKEGEAKPAEKKQ